MVPFDMPLDAKLALAKMSVIYEREVGNKIKMSQDEDIVSLINFAVDSFNEEIIRYLDTFLKLLDASEIRQLASQGANIYRGAVVPGGEVTDSGISNGQGNSGVRMYRGVPLAGTEKPVKTDTSNIETTTKDVKKGKRIYRGRVIED